MFYKVLKYVLFAGLAAILVVSLSLQDSKEVPPQSVQQSGPKFNF